MGCVDGATITTNNGDGGSATSGDTNLLPINLDNVVGVDSAPTIVGQCSIPSRKGVLIDLDIGSIRSGIEHLGQNVDSWHVRLPLPHLSTTYERAQKRSQCRLRPYQVVGYRGQP